MICMKKWTSSLKLVVILAQYRYTKTAQRIFKYSDIQYISLTLDKTLNSLVYRMLFYVNTYRSDKLLKTVRFFGPPCRSLLYINIYRSYKLLKTVRFLAHPVYIPRKFSDVTWNSNSKQESIKITQYYSITDFRWGPSTECSYVRL